MSKYKYVIFDLDGTLLDTLEDLTDGVNYIMEQYQMEKKTIAQIRAFVGNGVRKLMERCVPGGEAHPQFQMIYDDFRQYYTAHCKIKTGPYPGIPQLLEALDAAGYGMAIVSNKNDKAVEELNEDFFSDKISIAIGINDTIQAKPAPDTVYTALQRLGCQVEDAVYVGDSEVDRATAKNAGMPCVSVTWGFRDRELLESLDPECIIDEPSQLLGWLTQQQA